MLGHKPLCIYHGNCTDGFAAAWVVRSMMSEDRCEFYPGVHQETPPDVTGRDVLMVDFSYKRPVMESMAKVAHSILVIDHHKTAEEELAGCGGASADFAGWMDVAWRKTLEYPDNLAAVFDPVCSGATLTWKFMFPGRITPRFLLYVEDRDLWKNQLPGNEEFTLAVRSYPQDFEVWDRLIDRDIASLVKEGKPIARYYRTLVDSAKSNSYAATMAGHRCQVTNAAYAVASDAAGELAKDPAEFGAAFFQTAAGKWVYSLRSRGSFDVSEVAKKFGGGGHKNAAGFSVDKPVHEALDDPKKHRGEKAAGKANRWIG